MRSHSLLLAATFLAAAATPALASGISVPMDEARVVTFDKPVATVFVANPAVADINTIDSTHVFVLGKAFGGTNLIALDAQGHQVVSERLTVLGSNHLVTLNRGAAQFTFACATVRCEAATVPGDLHEWHDQRMSEIERHEDDGAKQAATGTGH
jgi:hypothetical protein